MSFVWISVFVIVSWHQCHATEANNNCTAAGRMPNNLSNDCRSFSMCLQILSDFTRIDLYCPNGTIFSHTEGQCTNITSYQCFSGYNCTDLGDFKNPNVSDCSSYVSCAEGLDGIVTARLTDCPPEMLYNPNERSCVNYTMFQCVVTTTEAPKVYEVSELISPESNHVNTTSAACFMKTEYINLIISLLLYSYNKILI